MKHKGLLIVPALLSIATLSACDLFMASIPNPITLEKSRVDYTYKDYGNNNAAGADTCPTIGTPKLLVIPVWFNDSSSFIAESKKETIRNDIRIAYSGSESETGWHSVSSFYKAESQGACELGVTVSNWYSVSSSYKTYGDERNGMDYTCALVQNATDWYFTNNPTDSRKNYDSDGNGYLDGVMLIYAAPDYGALNKDNLSNLWAYCYWLTDESQKSVANPGPNTFFWASYDFMYSSSTASSKTGKSSYGSGDTSHVKIDAHTYIHEMGHVFGLVDYYDYSDDKYCPAGGFSMQDYNIGGHDPYSLMAFGWSDPMVPTSTCTLELSPYQSNHDLVLLTNKFNSSPFDEYLLVEFYSPTGLNQLDCAYHYAGDYPLGPTDYGIRLWHVDARLVIFDNNDRITGFTTNPNQSNGYTVYHAMSNTYNDADYGSVLGRNYYDYNVLQLIRNDTSDTYRPKYVIGNSDLFVKGDSFSMNRYSKQFVDGPYMNSNTSLGWSFKVNSISSSKASITFTKSQVFSI